MSNPNPHLTPEFEQRVQEGIAQQQAEDRAGAEAAAVPFPGPLHDVYAGQQEIPVLGGRWKVRMFWDADFETLEQLNHPLASFLAAAMVGKTQDINGYTGRGVTAWQVNWILTRPVRVVSEFIRQQGPSALTDKAREEFGELQLHELSHFIGPVMEQLTRYWAPAPAPEPVVEGEKSRDPYGATSTDSVGSLRK